MNELNYHPDSRDPAFDAGYTFVETHRDRADGFNGPAPWWYGWMVRQAFWCGVRWAREQRSPPILGKVVDDGKVVWNRGNEP